MSGKSRLCLIIGRGGSKRLPRKNLLPLAGKPLIAHSIEQAAQTGLFTTIAVSSDDDEILQVAKDFNAGLLIKRPAELATDQASSLSAITHAVNYAEDELGIEYDSVTFLQITSPLRLPEDIAEAVKVFEDTNPSNLLSVTPSKASPYYTILEIKNGQVTISKNPSRLIEKNSKFPDTYDMNGSIYIWDKNKFLSRPQHLYADTKLLVMPKLRSIDIDYDSDFTIAEAVLNSGVHIEGKSYLLKC